MARSSLTILVEFFAVDFDREGRKEFLNLRDSVC